MYLESDPTRFVPAALKFTHLLSHERILPKAEVIVPAESEQADCAGLTVSSHVNCS